MNVRTGRALTLFAATLVASTALAYILPGGSILRRLSQARDELQLFSLRVDGTLTFKGPAVAEASTALSLPADRPELSADGSFLLKLPGRCRAEVSSPEGGKTALIQSGGKKRLEGTDLPALGVALDAICNLLAVRSSSDNEARALIERHLRSRGVEPQKTSLGRFGGTVAYVLGEAAPDKSQFWVYKDSFLPARLRYADAQGVAWDVRFLDYTSAATGEWFPRAIEVYRGSELALRFTGLKADARATLADKLF